MASSPEYSDLKWVAPKSWENANRGSVQVIVIHTTEGSEGPSSAEDGAAYDARRTDGTSTHYFHDSTSTVQCVRTEDLAHAARSQGNRRGIQHELCGRAGQGDAGWADDASRATLWQAAAQCARDAKKWGIPVRKLSPRDVAAGAKGICGHADITAAFPQDGGTHTDPGPDFPWADFLDMVRIEMEIDMGAAEDIAEAVAKRFNIGTKGVADKIGSDLNSATSGISIGLRAQVAGAVDAKLATILGAVAGVDEAVMAKLGDASTSNEDAAAALDGLLVGLFGPRKDAIVALMR